MTRHGRILAGQKHFRALRARRRHTPTDACNDVESTSQAEYAGSIPIIGSTKSQINAISAPKTLDLRMSLVAGLSLTVQSTSPETIC
jgi:hypothetical protein